MKLIGSALLLLSALLAGAATAATVDMSFDIQDDPVALGQAFSVDIVGNYTDSGALVGGSLNILFDPDILNVVDVTLKAPDDVDSTVWTIDNGSGRVDDIGFASFLGVTGLFTFATVDFTAEGSGTSFLRLEDANNIFFAWANDVPPSFTVTPAFIDDSITVVPLPHTLLLLLSGLAGFGFFFARASR